MKVVHLSTEISASSAPLRIHRSQKQIGIESKILTLRTNVDDEDIYVCNENIICKVFKHLDDFRIKNELKKYPNKKNVPMSFEGAGIKVSSEKLILDADVVHLHWINGFYLSVKEIGDLVDTGKKIVWTFHDSWPMTGGCHVRYGCEGFKKSCGNCPMLESGKENDITHKLLTVKEKYYKAENIAVATPSEWMRGNVKGSKLFGSSNIKQIGNPLDISIYKLRKEKRNDDKIHLLFGANGSLELEYKGYNYLVDALEYLRIEQPNITNKLVIHVFGTNKTELEGLEEFHIENIGFVHGDSNMAEMYSEADIYVFPSIDDNLPGTVMESLACETPVVAFATGGVPEMVQHKENGYVAEYKNHVDLANGILWVIDNNFDNILGKNGRKRVAECYSEDVIARQYIDLYNQLMK